MKVLLFSFALGLVLTPACSTRPSSAISVVIKPAKAGKPPFDSLSESIADEISMGCIGYELKFGRWPVSLAEIKAGLDRPEKFFSKCHVTLKEEAGTLIVRYMVPSGAVWDMTLKSQNPQRPNKAPEPTPSSVTSRAYARAKRKAFAVPYSDVGDPARLPKTTVFCQECGFVLLGSWTRESDDPSSFTQPFSSLLSGFPLPDKSRLTYLKYTQDLRGGFVASERLDYKTIDSVAVITAQVQRWAETHRLALVPPILPEIPAYRPYPSARLMTEQVQSWGYGDPNARVTGHVLFASYPEEGIVFIDLLITTPRHVKGSIDDELKPKPNKAPEPTPGAVTPRATEGALR